MASNSNNNLNLGMRCIKYMLIIINLMFVLTSILLIIVGTTIQAIYGDFSHFLDDNFLSPPALLVAVGIIMLIVAIFGVFGAIKESTLFINIYGVLLALVFFLQLAAAISAFALQGQVSGMLRRTMFKALRYYTEDDYVAEAVDFMQTNLICCGVNEPRDWEGLIEFPAGITDIYNETNIVPRSCCIYFDGLNVCEEFAIHGCYPRMNFLISQSAMLIATGATTVAFVQILGVICAFMLAKTIRRTKSLRLARRWQLQQSLGIGPMSGSGSAASAKNVIIHKPEYDNYTQLGKSDKSHEPVTYSVNSPSVN